MSKILLKSFMIWFYLVLAELNLWVVCHHKIYFMGTVSFFHRNLWERCHFFMPNVSKQLWVVCSWVVNKPRKGLISRKSRLVKT